jgi:hypothetical protein
VYWIKKSQKAKPDENKKAAEELSPEPQVLEEELSADEAYETLDGLEGRRTIVKDAEGRVLGEGKYLGAKAGETLTLIFQQKGQPETPVELRPEDKIKKIADKINIMIGDKIFEIPLFIQKSEAEETREKYTDILQKEWIKESKLKYGEEADKLIEKAKNDKEEFINELQKLFEAAGLPITEIESVTDEKVIRKKDDIAAEMMNAEVYQYSVGAESIRRMIPVMRVVVFANLFMADNEARDSFITRLTMEAGENCAYAVHHDKQYSGMDVFSFGKKNAEGDFNRQVILVSNDIKDKYKEMGLCPNGPEENLRIWFDYRITEGDKRYKHLERARKAVNELMEKYYPQAETASAPVSAEESKSSLTESGSLKKDNPPNKFNTALRFSLKRILQPMSDNFNKSSGDKGKFVDSKEANLFNLSSMIDSVLQDVNNKI